MRISDWSSDVCSSDLQSQKLAHYVVLPDGQVFFIVCGLAVAGSMLPLHLHLIYQISQIGRASCRERVCQYVSISVVAVSLKNKKNKIIHGKLVTKNG